MMVHHSIVGDGRRQDPKMTDGEIQFDGLLKNNNPPVFQAGSTITGTVRLFRCRLPEVFPDTIELNNILVELEGIEYAFVRSAIDEDGPSMMIDIETIEAASSQSHFFLRNNNNQHDLVVATIVEDDTRDEPFATAKFRLNIPNNVPSSMRFVEDCRTTAPGYNVMRVGDGRITHAVSQTALPNQCMVKYHLKASIPNTPFNISRPITVIRAMQIQHSNNDEDASQPQVHSPLTLTVGKSFFMTRSYLCGLWETPPLETFQLTTSSEQLVLAPGQSSLTVQLHDPEDKLAPHNTPSGISFHVKLTERITWVSNGRQGTHLSSWELRLTTTEIVPTKLIGTTTDGAPSSTITINAEVPIRALRSTFKGRLIEVYHDILVFVQTVEIVATTACIPVNIVT